MAAGPSHFSLMKSNQKSSQQRGFFAAQGLCPAPKESLWDKAGKTTGCIISRSFAPTNPSLQRKDAMPFPSHYPRLFYLLSPEAFLLTVTSIRKNFSPLLVLSPTNVNSAYCVSRTRLAPAQLPPDGCYVFYLLFVF
jgi:hypothetical protein